MDENGQWYKFYTVFKGHNGEPLAYSHDIEKLKAHAQRHHDKDGGWRAALDWIEREDGAGISAHARENLDYVIEGI